MKRILILSLVTLYAPSAFAVAETDYKCGPYTLSFFGPEKVTLADSEHNILKEWEGADSANVPTFDEKIKGKEVMFLAWNGQKHRCKQTASSP